MRALATSLVLVLLSLPLSAQSPPATGPDTAVVSRIIDEGMNRSQVMETEGYLTDVYGPRLTASPDFERAAAWAMHRLETVGVRNVHLEPWGPFGRGWSLKRFYAEMTEPDVSPLIAYPKAWSPGIKGTLKADVVYLDVKSEGDLAKYRGKLKGDVVLLSPLQDLKAHFEPDAERLSDSQLLRLADAGLPRPRGPRMFGDSARFQRFREMANLARMKMEFCEKEGAALLVETSRGDDGTLFVQAAAVPQPADIPYNKRIQPYDPKAPKILPQIVVAAEQYNRMIRAIEKGTTVKMEVALDVAFTEEKDAENIIGEIPGSDRKDEVVMIGGHFDSWHGGTGATDNASGSAVCIEAMRILQTLGIQPRRTIRIGLWSGEEEGLLGSAAYVRDHLEERDTTGVVRSTPDYEKFDVYFNNDNGTGKVRGVYLQGNEAARAIFRQWLEPFGSYGASTLSLSNTGGTDHLSFDAVGLPGFQFIQDEIDYETRTHHSNMDVYDRVQPDDLRQAATIMAAFAYDAAMTDQLFPRKPLPPLRRTR